MDSVRCICINDENKPKEIPSEKWIKKDDKYHITHIFIMKNQGMIQGVELDEFDISMHKPYNCYRLTRFAILLEDLEKFMALLQRSAEFNDIKDFDVKKYVDLIPTLEIFSEN